MVKSTGRFSRSIKNLSKSKNRLISNCSFQFANPEGTDLYRESHDYRFEHNKPKVRAERAAAAAYKGTSGKANPNPYRKIDDITSGKHVHDWVRATDFYSQQNGWLLSKDYIDRHLSGMTGVSLADIKQAPELAKTLDMAKIAKMARDPMGAESRKP